MDDEYGIETLDLKAIAAGQGKKEEQPANASADSKKTADTTPVNPDKQEGKKIAAPP